MASKRYDERRAKGGKWLPAATRLAIYIRDGFVCQYCGCDLRKLDPHSVTLDHLVCHKHGGSDEPTNLISSCKSCNSSRGTKSWRQYAPGGAIERIQRTRRRVLNIKLAKALINGTAGDYQLERSR